MSLNSVFAFDIICSVLVLLHQYTNIDPFFNNFSHIFVD